MSLRPTLTMAQKQMLVMTPKLQQAIKILQMPRLELAQYINQQMCENPVLDEADDSIEETVEEIEAEDKPDELAEDIPESELDLDTGLPDDTDVVTKEEFPEIDITSDDFGNNIGELDWEDYFMDHRSENEWEEPIDDDRQSNVPVVVESLQEHLLWQLKMSLVSESDYKIGEFIIGSIEDDGYLTVDIKEIAESAGCDVADLDRVLQIVQSFEPAGVGARNLKECLLIQLKQLDLMDTIAYEIVANDYLEDLESNRFPQIAKSLDVELELIREAVNVISTLEPKPGRQFSSIKPEYIDPDVIVEKIDGKYSILMNDYGPRLMIGSYYRNLLHTTDSIETEAREYIQSKIQSASWLLDSIERRRRTIHKVTESIFNVQIDFLEKGPKYIKPLTLREVADMVGVHEATVSRVVRNRYVQTPRGIFELKYFFGSGISTDDGGMASSKSVKEMMKNMVENEDVKNPLSDKDIESLMSQKGFRIARRTIAKYRDELNIPPSSKRKQW